jgi:hypothetical protein
MADPLRTVSLLGGAQRDDQWLAGAECNLDVRGAAERKPVQVVGRDLFHRNVAGGARNPQNLGFGAGKEIEKRQRVVDAGVDVDDELVRITHRWPPGSSVNAGQGS